MRSIIFWWSVVLVSICFLVLVPSVFLAILVGIPCSFVIGAIAVIIWEDDNDERAI